MITNTSTARPSFTSRTASTPSQRPVAWSTITMFLIVPKPRAAANSTSAQHVQQQQAPPSLAARTQNACDACRLRKVKCDGAHPCGRCGARKLVCVFSRTPSKAVGPVNEAHVASLQRQQQRLRLAVRRMAAVIDHARAQGYIGQPDPMFGTPSLISADLERILEQYAPEHEIDGQCDGDSNGNGYSEPKQNDRQPQSDGAAPSKKRRLSSVDLTRDSHLTAMQPAAPIANSHVDLYDPFTEFMKVVQQHGMGATDFLARPVNMPNPLQDPSHAASSAPASQAQPTLSNGLLTHETGAAPLPIQDASFSAGLEPAPFIDLVDWDASLQHFLNNQDAAAHALELNLTERDKL